MALSKVDAVRLRIGDSKSSPFYPLLNDDEIQYFLDSSGNNVLAAARAAATAAAFQLAAVPIKEIVDGEEIWNLLATEYRKLLDMFLKNSAGMLENGIMPYASGISWAEDNKYRLDPDNRVSPLVIAADSCEGVQYIKFPIYVQI